MEQTTLTTLSKALRTLDQFVLDASRKEHRVTHETLELTRGDFSKIWASIYQVNPKPYRTEVKEVETQGEDSVTISYTARNHRYSLKIIRFGSCAVAA